MSVGRDDVLPELMAGLFGRIRAELSGGDLGDLRMSHVRVLSAVPPDGINVTELARRAGMTKQGCGQFVTYLSGAGHLTTAPDPDDGRVRLVFRSSGGDREIERVYAALARIEDEFAAQVGPRRYATFKKVMAELVQSD
ncbi:MAG TPA: MarR family winged helix-turn-helix transcriptional regulator [Nocardioides sp.]|nr:MarR family winged helix-turn-helix transcriptional regulator [Nocardioides sp.]